MLPVAVSQFSVMRLAALAAAGLGLGGLVHLWAEHGATVYLHYLAGAAFTCL